VPLHLTVIRGQVAVVETPQAIPWPHLTFIDGPNDSYLRPDSGRLTLGGCDRVKEEISTDALDRYRQHLTPETRDVILERLCARIPAIETAGVRKGHAGIVTNSKDRYPLLGAVPQVDGLYCAVGFSGHGFKIAPAVGQTLAELVLAGRAELADITPFRPTRFEEGQPYAGSHPYL
jgi:glycine/D-amino acid oxidase-like deaminating enzyme